MEFRVSLFLFSTICYYNLERDLQWVPSGCRVSEGTYFFYSPHHTSLYKSLILFCFVLFSFQLINRCLLGMGRIWHSSTGDEQDQ